MQGTDFATCGPCYEIINIAYLETGVTFNETLPLEENSLTEVAFDGLLEEIPLTGVAPNISVPVQENIVTEAMPPCDTDPFWIEEYLDAVRSGRDPDIGAFFSEFSDEEFKDVCSRLRGQNGWTPSDESDLLETEALRQEYEFRVLQRRIQQVYRYKKKVTIWAWFKDLLSNCFK
jgi:hypothetical protein